MNEMIHFLMFANGLAITCGQASGTFFVIFSKYKKHR